MCSSIRVFGKGPKDPQVLYTIVTVLGYSSEFEIKTLLLNIPHS